jgi:hypothetical protein
MVMVPVNAAWLAAALGTTLAAVPGAASLAAAPGAVDGAVLPPLPEQALKATAPTIAIAAIGLILVIVTYPILLSAAVLGPSVRVGDTPSRSDRSHARAVPSTRPLPFVNVG